MRGRDQPEHVQVAERFKQAQRAARVGPEPERLDALARARVDREQHRHLTAHLVQRLEQLAQHRGIVDVRRAVQRDHRVADAPDLVSRRDVALRRLRQGPAQRVDHDVADEMDAIAGDPFGDQVVARVAGRGQEQVREPVAAARPRFDLEHQLSVVVRAELDLPGFEMPGIVEPDRLNP